MKFIKYILYVSGLLNIVFLVFLSIPTKSEKSALARAYEKVLLNEPYNPAVDTHFKIGVLTYSSSVPIFRILEGAQGELRKNKDVQYIYSFFSANDNSSLLRSMVEEVLSNDFDLILSIGQLATLMIGEISSKKGIKTPIVFAAVENPAQYQIIDSNEHPNGHITGSAAEPVSRHIQQLELMLSLKPNFKRVLLPYSPSAPINMVRDIDRIEAFLQSQGIPLKRVELDTLSDIVHRIIAVIEPGDLILTLRDGIVTSGMDAIVGLACRYGVSVFASHIDAIENGAVAAFGGREQDSGVGAAEKIRAILEEHKHPSEVPVTIPHYKYEFVINKSMMAKQNFVIDPLKLFLIERGKIVE